ncbi:hypothetical protein F5884DRAFT_143885 [Xylogone sp. PMI_703]|nr:hypothetical protein F5884DRAFT_143885 [Xylogone sp. PMI_703]
MDAEWHVTNQQRLNAIEVQRKKVAELERRAKIRELEQEARQRAIDDAAKRLDLQRAEKLAAVQLRKERRLTEIEVQKEKKLAAIKLRNEKKLVRIKLLNEKELAAIELQKQKRLASIELQKQRIQELERLERQWELDNAARRAELRKAKEQVKEQIEADRAEKARLNSLAVIEQDRALWHLQDEARALKLREQKRLRDEAGIKAGGAYKRPVANRQTT